MHEAKNSGFQSQTLAWSLIPGYLCRQRLARMQHENSEALNDKETRTMKTVLRIVVNTALALAIAAAAFA